MCDYSLHAVASRPAKVGETLITTTFPGTSTRGFAAEGRAGGCGLSASGNRISLRSTASSTTRDGSGQRARASKLPRFREVEPNVLPSATMMRSNFPNGSYVLVTLLVEKPASDGAAVARQPSRTRYNLSNGGRIVPARRHDSSFCGLRSCSVKTRRQEPAGLVARAFSRKLGRDEPANRIGRIFRHADQTLGACCLGRAVNSATARQRSSHGRGCTIALSRDCHRP